jgi:hypothetical protein
LKTNLFRAGGMLVMLFLSVVSTTAMTHERSTFVITSTNNASGNAVLVFELDDAGTPSLSLVKTLPTGGMGGAAGNAGAVQFADGFGAVVNYGSNNVTELQRDGNSIGVVGRFGLAPKCVNPVSVALADAHAFVVGANCAESHAWPSGNLDGSVVAIPDTSAGQIVTGMSWSAVTLKSGSVLRLLLGERGELDGNIAAVTLPGNANNTPLGAAFWGDILGFNPAHSPYSFTLVNKNMDVFPVLGPQPAYPVNAPCWLAKGAGNVWYAGNSPGHAISIFFSDGQGGTFYKSLPLPGVPTDITVSPDGKWLAVIYTAADGSGGRIAVFSIDTYGDLSLAATSNPTGVASFNGVAISQ